MGSMGSIGPMRRGSRAHDVIRPDRRNLSACSHNRCLAKALVSHRAYGQDRIRDGFALPPATFSWKPGKIRGHGVLRPTRLRRSVVS